MAERTSSAHVKVETIDRRTFIVRFPVPAAHLAAVLEDVDEQYMFVGASLVEGGSQRDPTTIGVRLEFKRSGTA